jgi:hypothetical protein
VGDNDARILSPAEKAALTGGGVTNLHSHSSLGNAYQRSGFLLGFQGELTTGQNKSFPIECPYDGTFEKWRFELDPPDATGSTIVDVHKNGTTIWSTQSNRPTLATGASNAVGTVFNTTTFSKGDRLTLDLDQIGTGANRKLSLQLNLRAAVAPT